MLNNKLIILLEAFTKYDLNRFRKYLASPYFNENERLSELFEIINEGLRSDNVSIDKLAVWKKLFPKKNYNDTKFRRLCSDLTRLGQDFLGYKVYQERPSSHLNHTLQGLNRLGLGKHFLAVERNLLHLMDEKSDLRNTDYHLAKYVVEYERHLYFEKNAVRRTRKVNLTEADFALDCYYLTWKLKNYCDALNYKNVLNIDISIGLIQELLELIQDTVYMKVPSVGIYYQIILTLIDKENQIHFKTLKKLLEENGTTFPQKELRTMYIFAQNYCIKKINTGNLAYFKELFDIYKTLLSTKVIFGVKGQLSLSNYKNIITVGLASKEFGWVEEFIHRYNERLPKIHRKNALIYNLAHLEFNKENYPRVIELLREMEYRDAFDGLSSRWLLLKTYYELDEFDALDALTDSFRIFLRRNKMVSQTNKQKYLNAVRFVNKIIRLGFKKSKEYNTIYQQLMEAKAIVDKKWLLQKLEEMR